MTEALSDEQRARKQKAYAFGLEAEEQAAAFLRQLGFEEVERRARMQGGEIDLIVEDEQTLVFVEVKARKRLDSAVESVSARQQARIRVGLRAWLAIHDADGTRLACQSVRCDVVVVAPGHDPLHIPNAFPASLEAGF